MLHRRKDVQMRSRILSVAAIAALSTLGACGTQPENLSSTVDTQAEALRNAAPVQLPPSVQSTKAYRCADNSLAYVEFYNNNTAHIAATRGGTPTNLTSTSPTGPFTAEGYSVSGTGDVVQIRQPGKPEQRCHT